MLPLSRQEQESKGNETAMNKLKNTANRNAEGITNLTSALSKHRTGKVLIKFMYVITIHSYFSALFSSDWGAF